MTAADLVDLEWRLALDEDASATLLAERDTGIAAAADTPESALSIWLQAWRRERSPTPGMLFGRAVRLVQTLGMGLAFLAGATLAGALLHYDGGHPVNVLTYVWSALGLQWVLLLLLALTGAASRVYGGLARVPVLGEAYQLLGALVAAVARRLGGGPDAQEWRARGAAVWGRLRGRASLYSSVESSMLLRVTQNVAAAFNLGLLAALLWQVAFTDLSFGWSTTLDLDAEELARWTHAFATPWATLWPEAVPTSELIETTRYARDSGFAGAAADGMAVDARAWWRFLVAATVCYGFLPREVLATVALLLERRALRNLPLDTPAVAAVLARIRSPRLTSAGVASSASATRTESTGAGGATVSLSGRVVLVTWREAATERSDLPHVEGTVALGGPDHAADERAIDELAQHRPESVLVLADAWEAPDAALRRVLQRLRGVVGTGVPIVVRLVGRGGAEVTPREHTIWRDEVARLADPYVAVEAAR